jgi:beta-N-acetylhexosaminidase
VVAGVQAGRFTQARVDSSVRKLLVLKARFNLPRHRFVDLDSVRMIVGDTANLAVASVAAERSITLARDSLGLVPMARTAGLRLLSVTLASRSDLGAGTTFNAELRRVYPRLRTAYVDPEDPGTNYERVLGLADSADAVVLQSYVAQSYLSASAAAPTGFVEFLQSLPRRMPRTVVVNFGNPYLLQHAPDLSTYMVAWGGFPVSQRAAARALVGLAPITGRLPISIPPLVPFGAGLDRAATAPAPAAGVVPGTH